MISSMCENQKTQLISQVLESRTYFQNNLEQRTIPCTSMAAQKTRLKSRLSHKTRKTTLKTKELQSYNHAKPYPRGKEYKKYPQATIQ